ncbi:MAG: NUDIX hydrolase [Ruminococcaceae bacterium]|nr:NUDIX hydrolase [Oscillospiraceae bacterium]
MELWDAYTREGVKTGETLVRDEPIREGLYHLVCEVLVRHVDGSFLCMIRSRRKPNYPLYPECTAGGSALKGEDALECIRRELREETGIEWTEFEEVARTVREQYATIFISYLCTVDWPKAQITLQEGETESFRWLSEPEFIELLNSDRMIPGQPERMRGYYQKMGFLRNGEEQA